MARSPFDTRPVAAMAGARAVRASAWAWAVGLCLALSGPAAAAPLRLSLETVAAPGPTAEAVAPKPAPAAPGEEAADELSFVAAPDLPFPDLSPAAGVAGSDDDWLQAARLQHDDAAGGTDRRLGGFAPAVVAALTISTDPIDEVTLQAARPEADATPAPQPVLLEAAGGMPALAWAAVPLVALLLLSMMAAA
ncbi:MAG: hypothetical protein RJA10_4423, partial [Pseudomonadota bacterium]